MKKRMKKIIASISAAVFAIPMMSITIPANAYYSGQQHTWRMVEKTSTIGMEWYSSVAIKKSNYTFGASQKGDLIVNAANFQSSYSSNLSALTTSYSGSPKINGGGYLSKSTWYTPTTVTSFSMNYSYETSNGAVITPIYVLVGDVNQDGYVNNSDAEYLAKYLASQVSGSMSLTEKQMLAADANNDGKVSALDCSAIAAFAEGNKNHF
ncbi:dockerin type I repeat-containing protein [Ruminococcus sp.]|uniref:dockerin type I repeat-containing protein n=1 Tax=Ruminococcus sp. TaxID=41978 RepID=UPI0025DD5A11|nr:dockerin type I repeat-containing protein [Ruminococcus sp.]